MSSELINRNPDLLRLRNEGFEVSVRSSNLVVSAIPYVDSAQTIQFGTLVSSLEMSGDQTKRPSDHVVGFSGSQPCHRDGSPISGIQHGEQDRDLGGGVMVNRSFSNKPVGGYPDYYSKITRYVEIISAPASAMDPSVTPRTFHPVEEIDDNCPFVYLDTNSSRAGIGSISAKLEGQCVAIIGVGGTGSYVLDFVAKTPVREIHLFDKDRFYSHNAFRAPGAASLDELKQSPSKADHFCSIYSRMHRGVIPHSEYIDANNLSFLEKMDFIFICMDSNPHKGDLLGYLLESKIPFVDAGLGIEEVDGKLLGMIRTTSASSAKTDHISKCIPIINTPDDDYSSNIQIGELNALNAALAVIKWKKAFGFFVDLEHEHNSIYSLAGNTLHSEEISA